jgi:2-hydroxy-3-keto-5-methylthiopentenyl-1-phosphate phosphatase
MPRFVIFSDFDGTITTRDTGTILIDIGMGIENRKVLDKQILHGEITFRKAVEEMWNSVSMSWEDALRELEVVQLDPFFLEFYEWTLNQKLDLTIVSRFYWLI